MIGVMQERVRIRGPRGMLAGELSYPFDLAVVSEIAGDPDPAVGIGLAVTLGQNRCQTGCEEQDAEAFSHRVSPENPLHGRGGAERRGGFRCPLAMSHPRA